MRTAAIVVVALLLAGPAASAQQLKFKPSVDFKKGLKLPAAIAPPEPRTHSGIDRDEAKRRIEQARAHVKSATQPIDCAMVKPVDPKFHSHMPVVQPRSEVKFTMKVTIAPPCGEK